MATLYFLALLPLFAGAFFWLRSKRIVWWEWLAATGVGLITVAIMHAAIYHSLVADQVTVSGQLVKTTFHPEWTEEYWVTVCETHGSGKDQYTTCHQERRTTWHPEYWDTDTNIRSSHRVDKNFYNQIVKNFGGVKVTEDGHRYGLIDGDPNIYVTYNKTGYIYPVVEHRYWENPVKASRSLFKYGKVPEKFKKQIFEYPENRNWKQSNRLLGRAKQDFTITELDKLNAILGPIKKVNIVIVGFGSDTTQEIAEYQKAAWMGGKENDIVITYGGPEERRWVHVFGWTEKEIVKANLETLFLTNKPGNNLLPKVKDEIIQNYQLKDWSKFNYLSIEPPSWAWIVVLIVMVLVQGGFWYFAHTNEVDKSREESDLCR